MTSSLVAPSILAADFCNLQRDIELINDSEADWFHLDVMDGIFVPNISFGMPVIEAIQQYAKKPLDIHLMITNPDRYIPQFASYQPKVITVHYEACNHLHRSLQSIRDLGIKAGVALNPHTPVSLLSPILDMIDLVCIMSVNPGFGGQKFIENTYNKVSEFKSLINAQGVDTLIEIDGGVNADNAGLLSKKGADVLVAGSSVFRSNNPYQSILDIKNA